MMSEISPLQIDSHLRHHLQIIFFRQALSSFRIFLNFLNAFTNFPLRRFSITTKHFDRKENTRNDREESRPTRLMPVVLVQR